jgi:hypothetical protein
LFTSTRQYNYQCRLLPAGQIPRTVWMYFPWKREYSLDKMPESRIVQSALPAYIKRSKFLMYGKLGDKL